MLLRRNKKGQAALFIVLVFQVLFILFAMSLNVAMVVYDKINLQNSLDLASYYGAKKQAEALNAMAHINYQMRQNWKLLTWRYRMLGTLVQYQGDYLAINRGDAFWCPQNTDKQTNCRVSEQSKIPERTRCQQSQNLFSRLSLYPGYCDNNYFSCISHDLWARGVQDSEQNLCTTSDVSITSITQPIITAPFMPETWIASEAVADLIAQVNESCPLEGALNWLTVQLFLSHFRLDQKDRKVMIKEIYNRTLKAGKDLDREDIFEGSKKVFFGNLSKANRENVENLPDYGLIEYSSFQNKNFNAVFEELFVRPILNYLDSYEDNGHYASCPVQITPHFLFEESNRYVNTVDEARLKNFIDERFGGLPALKRELEDKGVKLFRYNMGFVENEDPLQSLTLSFFKRTDQALYYGLRTDFEYQPTNQIFSLNLSSGIQFKGSSFAKAFGGSFGPQPEQSDPFIPNQQDSSAPLKFVSSQQFQITSTVHQPNYSRWPGDQWGLVDRRLHDPKNPLSFLNKQNIYVDTQKVYRIQDYFHIILGGNIMDPLARNRSNDSQNFVRMMEWMAVYPDLYDINHYSILANYHQSYFPKICNLLKGSICDPRGENSFNSSDAHGRSVFIRGDLGWPDSDHYIQLNQRNKTIDLSLAPYFLKQGRGIDSDQLRAPPYIPPTPPSPPPRYLYTNSNRFKGWHGNVANGNNINPPPLTQGNLFYPWLAGEFSRGEGLPGGLLSSWFNPKPLDYKNYDFDNRKLEAGFLKCEHKALSNRPVSSSCVGLGRTGYSVKLLSCDKVKQLRPQPGNIDDYCD